MRVCEAYRIPHSHFLGGPPRWSQADRDKAIWFQVHKAQTCGGCGTHPDDWDLEQGGHPYAFEVVEVTCPGCRALEQKQERSQKAGSAPKGMSFALRRQEDPGARHHRSRR